MKTLDELAHILDVPVEVAGSWLRFFGEFVPSTEEEGRTVYEDEAVELLREVARMDGEGKRIGEIRETLYRLFVAGEDENSEGSPAIARNPSGPERRAGPASAMADAMREVLDAERRRSRRTLATFLFIFLLFVGAALYAGHRFATDMRTRAEPRTHHELPDRITGLSNELVSLTTTMTSLKADAAAAVEAIQAQEQEQAKKAEQLGSAVKAMRAWSDTEGMRIAGALNDMSARLAEIETNLTRRVSADGIEAFRAEVERWLDEIREQHVPAARPPTAGVVEWEQAKLEAEAAGDMYVGEFDENGRKHGYGRCVYDNGDTYVGEFRNGTKHGRGAYTLQNGDVYIGEFRDNQRNGSGIYFYDNGDSYAGEFENGERGGYGVYTYASGARYVGAFRAGQRHGRGCYIDPSGHTMDGEWTDGRLADAGEPKNWP